MSSNVRSSEESTLSPSYLGSTEMWNDSFNLSERLFDVMKIRDHLEIRVPLFGVVSPVVILLTVITNSFVCVVLMEKSMRNPTNLLLVFMAISDTMTGLFPVPLYLYFYTLGHYVDYVPFNLCYPYDLFTNHFPTVFHTASIWLTVVLSIQRYICVCHHQLAKSICVMRNCVKAVIFIYAAAFLSQITRIVENEYIPVELESAAHEGQTIVGCRFGLTLLFEKYATVIFGVYWWFRVIFIHIIPCTALVILNGLLFSAMRTAQVRRDILFKQNRRTESKRLAETNLATMMLVTVVCVFLCVELPLAVLLLIMIYENTLGWMVITSDDRAMAGFFINLLILFSYPLNFFIYCGMSRQFRGTFARLFFCRPKSSTYHNAENSLTNRTKHFVRAPKTEDASGFSCHPPVAAREVKDTEEKVPLTTITLADINAER